MCAVQILEFLETGKLQALVDIEGGGSAAGSGAPAGGGAQQAKQAEKAEASLKFA